MNLSLRTLAPVLAPAVSLCVLAAVAAWSATSVLSALLLPGVPPEPALVASVEPPTPSPTPRPAAEPPQPRRAPTPRPQTAPQRSALPWTLVGTLVSKSSEWSLASVEDSSTRRVQTWMQGDHIEDAEVLSITRDRILLRRGEVTEYIDFTRPSAAGAKGAKSSPATRPLSPSSRAPPRAGHELAPGLREESPGHWRLPRTDLVRVIAHLPQLSTQARIAPAFEDGVPTGFKLLSIRPDSVLTQLGVRNGDVVRRINGYSLDSFEKVMEAYTRLKEAPRVDIELVRNGATIRHSYSIDG